MFKVLSSHFASLYQPLPRISSSVSLHIDRAIYHLSSLVYSMQCATVLKEQLTVALTVKVILQMQLLASYISPILFLWILSFCIHFLHTDILALRASADSVKDVLVEKTEKQTEKRITIVPAPERLRDQEQAASFLPFFFILPSKGRRDRNENGRGSTMDLFKTIFGS